MTRLYICDKILGFLLLCGKLLPSCAAWNHIRVTHGPGREGHYLFIYLSLWKQGELWRHCKQIHHLLFSRNPDKYAAEQGFAVISVSSSNHGCLTFSFQDKRLAVLKWAWVKCSVGFSLPFKKKKSALMDTDRHTWGGEFAFLSMVLQDLLLCSRPGFRPKLFRFRSTSSYGFSFSAGMKHLAEQKQNVSGPVTVSWTENVFNRRQTRSRGQKGVNRGQKGFKGQGRASLWLVWEEMSPER